MKKYFQSAGYIAFIAFTLWALIKAVTTYKNPFSLYENPLVWSAIIGLFFVIVLKEYVNITSQKVAEQLRNEKLGITISEEEEESWFKQLIKRWTKSRSIEEEGTIELDHNYDGIRELDNVLPPWWLYLFYITIVFAGVYLVRYHIIGADSQEVEYNKAMAQAKLELEKYKESSPDVFDVNSVELLTEEADLARGKAVFNLNCAACHANDGGGGIGPNLTDKHWILGGGFKNAFNTIYNGGRDGKGMVAWNKTLKPQDIQKVASYIMTLQGTKPANPKAPEGDVWKEEAEAKGEILEEENK